MVPTSPCCFLACRHFILVCVSIITCLPVCVSLSSQLSYVHFLCLCPICHSSCKDTRRWINVITSAERSHSQVWRIRFQHIFFEGYNSTHMELYQRWRMGVWDNHKLLFSGIFLILPKSLLGFLFLSCITLSRFSLSSPLDKCWNAPCPFIHFTFCVLVSPKLGCGVVYSLLVSRFLCFPSKEIHWILLRHCRSRWRD